VRRLSLALLLAAACAKEEPPPRPEPPPPDPKPVAASGLPDRVTYEQILVVFEGSYVRDGRVKVETRRTREEAGALARSLLERAQAGVDFDALKEEWSDDRDASTGLALGPYTTVKDGLRREPAEIPLSRLSKAMADVVYRLKVGEVGLVEYDERRSSDGWLVVKRIR
jgi:hypothetical protein